MFYRGVATLFYWVTVGEISSSAVGSVSRRLSSSVERSSRVIGLGGPSLRNIPSSVPSSSSARLATDEPCGASRAFSAFSRSFSSTQLFVSAARSIALFVARRASSSMRPRISYQRAGGRFDFEALLPHPPWHFLSIRRCARDGRAGSSFVRPVSTPSRGGHCTTSVGSFSSASALSLRICSRMAVGDPQASAVAAAAPGRRTCPVPCPSTLGRGCGDHRHLICVQVLRCLATARWYIPL